MATNKLYYGMSNHINDIVIQKYVNKTEIKHQKIYKNITYTECMSCFIFFTLNMKIIEFINSIIYTNTIDNNKRTIILCNIEQVDYDTSSAFRIILERYSTSNVFIATTVKISSIDKPIISRFMLIRVPVDQNTVYIKTPIQTIKTKPDINQIKILTKKCKKFEVRDIIIDLINITPYKKGYAIQASDIEHQYVIHKDKMLTIEALIISCFYPSKDFMI